MYCGLHACCPVSASEIEKSCSFISPIYKVLPRKRPDRCEHPWRRHMFCLRIFFFLICFVSFHLRKPEAGKVWSNHEKIHFPVMGITRMPACVCGTGVRALNLCWIQQDVRFSPLFSQVPIASMAGVGKGSGSTRGEPAFLPCTPGWEFVPSYHPRLSGAVCWSPC